MFAIKKTFEVAISHSLTLPYESKCSSDHGHNLIITVYAASSDDYVERNNGMVIDFTEVKRKVHDIIDHECLNNIEGIGYEKPFEDPNIDVKLNPTAENIARWICNQFNRCYRVDVQESSGNIATYIDNGRVPDDTVGE